jgi:hypothetical protein
MKINANNLCGVRLDTLCMLNSLIRLPAKGEKQHE